MDKLQLSEAEQIASELLAVIPLLNRIVAYELRKNGEDETTIVQLRVLASLNEEPLTVSELAKKRRVSLQAVSEHSQVLVERGWVERVPDLHDRRRFLLHITDAGRTQFEGVRSQLILALAPTLAKLTEDENFQIHQALESLRQVLVDHPTE